jgi:hypothetical protein
MKNMQIRFPIKNIKFIMILILLSSCSSEKNVTINFDAYVNGEELEYGKKYASPNGDGTFSINDFKLYVSNLQFISNENPDKNYIEKDSYHLLRFQAKNSYSFILNNISLEPYDKIKISIGIDEKSNLSINRRGDLDPTNQMAWNWTSGYKFLLFEGLYSPESSDNVIPIVFHIGFSVNKKDLEFDISTKEEIQFVIDINELFKTPNNIDFNKLPKVLFNKEHAALLASNYADSFIKLE